MHCAERQMKLNRERRHKKGIGIMDQIEKFAATLNKDNLMVVVIYIKYYTIGVNRQCRVSLKKWI
jgi:hypothetical protein